MPSIEQLQKLLTLDERDTFVLYALAQELDKAGDHAGAVGYYDRCLAVDEAYSYAYFHKARSLEALGDLDAARETLAAGLDVAQRVGDSKATSEIGGYLEELRLRS